MSETLPQSEPDRVDKVATDLDAAPTTAEYKRDVQAMKHELDAGATASGDYWKSLEEVWSQHVDNEPDPLLRQFNEVMLNGPNDAYYQGQAEQYRERRRVGNLLTRDERTAEHDAVNHTIENNHRIRDMLQVQADNFTRQEFAAWYSTFLDGNQKLADSRASGAYAEIAVGSAAAGMTDTLDAVTWGSVEEDAHGGDIVARKADDLTIVKIDVKAGMQLPKGWEDETGIHLTVGVPNGYFDRHGRVDGEGIEGLQRAIALGIQQRKIIKRDVKTA